MRLDARTIRREMIEARLTQIEAARLIGKTQGHISAVLARKVKGRPTLRKLRDLLLKYVTPDHPADVI